MPWLCWGCQNSGELRAPPGTCCGSLWVPPGSSGTAQSMGTLCRTQHQTESDLPWSHGLKRSLLFIHHCRLIPDFLSEIFFTSPIQILLFPPSHSLVLAVPAVLSLSCVSLGCSLHYPNSSKFHVFFLLRVCAAHPNSAPLSLTCKFYQQVCLLSLLGYECCL